MRGSSVKCWTGRCWIIHDRPARTGREAVGGASDGPLPALPSAFLSCSQRVPNAGGVRSLDSTFNTLRYSQSCFMREEAPHGSDSLCKQNLKQNRPPVNSRQPRIDTFPAQNHVCSSYSACEKQHFFVLLLKKKKKKEHMQEAPRC